MSRGKYNHYLVHEAPSTRCPDCKGTVDMLARARHLDSAPSFWICWACKRVWQIGKEPVQRLQPHQRIPWNMPTNEPTS